MKVNSQHFEPFEFKSESVSRGKVIFLCNPLLSLSEMAQPPAKRARVVENVEKLPLLGRDEFLSRLMTPWWDHGTIAPKGSPPKSKLFWKNQIKSSTVRFVGRFCNN